MLRNYLPASFTAAFESMWLWLGTAVLTWSSLAQLGVLAVAFGLFLLIKRPLRNWLESRTAWLHAPAAIRIGRATAAAIPWLLLALLLQFAAIAFSQSGEPSALMRLAISLVLAWTVIRLISRLVRDPRIARLVAVIAWLVAALNIAGLLPATFALLAEMAVVVGGLRISVLLVLKAAVVLCVALWLANLITRVTEARLRSFTGITPSMQVLAAKLLRAALLTIAAVLALGTVGIDLTAFAVFSGAVGVGIGFGLQKVVSNLISGVILLLDNSIKPGDVIELSGTYGWITQLNARYVSIVTRDGTEHLIPNEDLITQPVVNWTYSDERLRLHVPIGVSYKSDIRQARAICAESARAVARVERSPAPVCLITGFGDSSVNLELRFWISDPRKGVAAVKSDVMQEVWDRFLEAGIEIPFPQRDIHVLEPLACRQTGAAPVRGAA